MRVALDPAVSLALVLFVLVPAPAASTGATPADYCLAFQRVSDYAMPAAVFSEVDRLPKAALTVAFKFRLLARRQPSTATQVGFRSASSGGLLGFGTMPSGDAFNVDFGSGGLTIPAPGGFSFGWHHVAVSFDSAEGVLRGYFDGVLTANKSYAGKVPTVTFGAGWVCLRPRSCPFRLAPRLFHAERVRTDC